MFRVLPPNAHVVFSFGLPAPRDRVLRCGGCPPFYACITPGRANNYSPAATQRRSFTMPTPAKKYLAGIRRDGTSFSKHIFLRTRCVHLETPLGGDVVSLADARARNTARPRRWKFLPDKRVSQSIVSFVTYVISGLCIRIKGTLYYLS